jgi:hypothetical protein
MTATARMWIAASLLLLLGCYHGTRTHPLPGALRATSTHSVREIAAAALATLNGHGISVEQYRPDSGLVESAWFDIVTLDPRAQDYPADEREVRFRVLAVADPAGGPTHVYLEVVQHGVDPLGSRFREREVPSDHPAMSVARRLMDRLTDRLGS